MLEVFQMAIENKYGILVSYPCEELIQDVAEDIVLFGENNLVYAVWEHFDVVDGVEYDVDFIVDYVDYKPPTEEEFYGESCDIYDRYNPENDITLESLMEGYRANLKSTEHERVELMTLKELLTILLKQDSLFD